jgi:hypothetical protein
VGVTDRMAAVDQRQPRNTSWPLFREVNHTDVVVLQKTSSVMIIQFAKQNSPGQGHKAVKLNTRRL